MAGDNSSKQKEAKEWIWAAVKGLAVIAFGYILISFINPQILTVEEIDIEFVRLEEAQPAPAGITTVDRVPESEREFFTNKPIPGARVSSAFGLRKLSDDVRCRLHSGIDFNASQGTPVYATADGRVIKAGVQGGYGNLVQIRDDKGYVYYFAHLSAFSVSAGDQVSVGDPIGRVGSTGHSFGAHLHYEIRKNNIALDINSALGARYPTGNGEVYCAGR
jgi:murein DD-endopeptidase MepM/ murein hydrolase activator NlpD